MTPFVTVSDETVAETICQATKRLIYVAPGVGVASAKALVQWSRGQRTIVLDSDPDVCRIGFGDAEGLEIIAKAIADGAITVQRQDGLRVGLLVADETVLVWAPPAQSVEKPRAEGQPNGLLLSAAQDHSLADVLSDSAATTIGQDRLDEATVQAAVQDLKANPPAPFDLSQRSRVFSTKFQFVEHEVRGAEWTERKVKLSSLLLNPDLPESVQDILETQVRPFQGHGDLECDVPGFLNGQPAFDAAGVRILVKVKQSEVVKQWTDIRTSYLRKLTGFGWLIRRDRVEAFRQDVAVFEQVLKVWVEAFKDKASRSRGDQVGLLVDAIVQRIPAARRNDLPRKAVEQQVADGLDRLRVIEPRVRIVFKDVAWESSRDDEFLAALEAALPAEELKGWFEEFAVVRQRQKGSE